MKNILVPLDFSEHANFEEDDVNNNIPRAVKTANMFAAEMNFLYVNTPVYFEDSETSRYKMNQAYINFLESQKHIFNHFSVENGIIGFAKVNSIDTICITTYSFTSLRRFFNNNIVEHLVNYCKRPILSLHVRN